MKKYTNTAINIVLYLEKYLKFTGSSEHIKVFILWVIVKWRDRLFEWGGKVVIRDVEDCLIDTWKVVDTRDVHICVWCISSLWYIQLNVFFPFIWCFLWGKLHIGKCRTCVSLQLFLNLPVALEQIWVFKAILAELTISENFYLKKNKSLIAYSPQMYVWIRRLSQ